MEQEEGKKIVLPKIQAMLVNVRHLHRRKSQGWEVC